MRSNETRRKTCISVAAILGVAALVIAAIPALAVPDVSDGGIDDDQISNAVDAALIIDDGVSAQNLDVATTQGVVTLSGSVGDLLAKERAVELATKVKGVRSVVDRIEVSPPLRLDSELRSDVLDALLADPATDSWEIDVTVDGGVVRLTGAVDSWAEKELCASVAKSVRGVREVQNDVVIEFDGDRGDYEIEAEIERRLEVDVWVDAGLIEVEVVDGEVTLSGSVGSAAEKNRAHSRAWVAGVTAVDDSELEVEWWADSPSHRESPYERPADEEIEQAVKDAMLYDPRVYSYRPTVTVDAGVVTLRGTVHDYQAKRAAEAAARNTYGVWRVRNLLKVRPDSVYSDATLYERIEDSLERSLLVDEDDVTFTVVNGRVQLYGETSTHYERSKAEEIVGNVLGVVDVDNNIDVADHWSYLNDVEIEQDVEDELWWSPFVDADEVSVEVEDGVVTLRGTVDSMRERRVAVKNAFDGGAVAVRSKLTVEGHGDYWSEYHRYPPRAYVPF